MSVSNTLKYHVVNFINNRPLCLLSSVIGVKDFILGLGFILASPEITRTLLYQNYDALEPGISGVVAGWILVIMGLITFVTAAVDKIEVTRYGLRASAFIWLFSGIMYLMDGNYILAVGIGFFMSIPAGYLAFYYKYAPMWRENKRKLRAKYHMDNA